MANVKFSSGGGVRLAATLEAGAEFAPSFRLPERENGRIGVRAVLLSIDGVLVDTRAYRAAAWQQLAEDLQFPFDPSLASSLPGLPAMDALDALLGPAARDIGPVEKDLFLDRQQFYYRRLLATLSPTDVVHGGRLFAAHVRAAGVKLGALVPDLAGQDLIQLLGMGEAFDAVFDARGIDDESLRVAAAAMGAPKGTAIIITACDRTLRASRRAAMRTLGIASHMSPYFSPDAIAPSLAAVSVDQLDSMIGVSHPPASITPAA